MSYLVLGAQGMLGRAFAQALDPNQTSLLGRAEFNLETDDPLELLHMREPRVVINCAAYTDVDGAEGDVEGALKVNAEGVGRLADACRRLDATLLHFSTDYVFDGSASHPYEPLSPKHPINIYGMSKAEGEDRALASGADLLIVRASWIFAPWGKNFVKTMSELLRTRPEVRVVADQIGCPTFAPELAQRSLALLHSDVRGIVHITGEPPVSWYEFALAIQEAQGSRAKIIPVSSEEFPRPARRPRMSVLSSEATSTALGPPADFRTHLRASLAL